MLLELCWKYDSFERPSFVSLAFLFRNLNEIMQNEDLVTMPSFPNFRAIDCDFRIKTIIIDVKQEFSTFKNAHSLPYLLSCY